MKSVVNGEAACYPSSRKGPYVLKENPPTVKPPSKTVIEIERATVTMDVELTMMQRSFWSSYCYQGTGFDPNTGCFSGLTQALPGYVEAQEWVKKQQCAIGWDCKDCYGDASDACLRPMEGVKKWVKGKELERIENNNHIARHTCNLSWRCSIHKSKFPTFLTNQKGIWKTYTEYENGTQIMLSNTDFWVMPDMVMKKTQEPEFKVERIPMACFQHRRDNMITDELSCYDDENGNFIEFRQSVKCIGKTCYRLLDKPAVNTVIGVNLKSASLEDLHRVIQTEHLLNEELRYNFGQILQLVNQQQQIINTIINSVAKIDDKLIGNILGNRAHSTFMGETQFYMVPCKEPVSKTSNCNENMIFQNGRWKQLENATQCKNFTEPIPLALLNPEEMWLPEEIDVDDIGIAADFEGWTLYEKERGDLARAMEYSVNAQSTTSMADLMEYPKGLLNATLLGFLTSHVMTIAAVVLVLFYLKARAVEKRAESNNLGGGINIISNISRPENLKVDPTSLTKTGVEQAKDYEEAQKRHPDSTFSTIEIYETPGGLGVDPLPYLQRTSSVKSWRLTPKPRGRRDRVAKRRVERGSIRKSPEESRAIFQPNATFHGIFFG